MSEELLTVQQIADRLQVRPSWVYAHSDQLGVVRVGKYLRFRFDLAVELLEARSSQHPAEYLNERRN